MVSGSELFRFDGKRVLVVGGATGMGAASAQLVAQLGGECTVADVVDVDYPCARSLKVDLASKDDVVRMLAELDGPYDSVFSCAGVADGAAALMKINFISQRHIIDHLVATEMIGRGSSVAMISSVGGAGWVGQVERALEFLDNDTWEAMDGWVAAHEGTNSYGFSKVAMNTYVASRALGFARRGMRINAVMPGGTDTPLARKNAETWLPFQADYREATGLPRLSPEQMATAVAFLCMDAASGINGTTLTVDDGYIPSIITGTIEQPQIKAMLGI